MNILKRIKNIYRLGEYQVTVNRELVKEIPTNTKKQMAIVTPPDKIDIFQENVEKSKNEFNA
jgi:hypothetical protein